MDIKALDFAESFKKDEARVGVVGISLVGLALQSYFDKHGIRTLVHDRFASVCSPLVEVVRESHVIFVCVPAPVKEDQTRNTDNIHEAIGEIARTAGELGRPLDSFVVCISSPVNPGFTQEEKATRPDMRLVYMPEFLSSKKANLDMLTTNRIIVGGDMDDARIVLNFFLAADRRRADEGKCALVQCDATAAELTQIFVNGYLLSKVMFFKQMHDVCAATGQSFDEVRVLVCLDPRIGPAFTRLDELEEREIHEDYIVFSALLGQIKKWDN